jgi:hypothetical protein
MKRALPVLLLLVMLPTGAQAQEPEHGGGGVKEARRAHGATRPPEHVAGGAITVAPTEGLAGDLRSVRVTLAAGAAPVDLDYPARFRERAANGRAYVRGTPSGRTLRPADRTVEIDVSGLPAGTYRLPVRRGGKLLGTAEFRLYAQRKEGDEQDSERLRGPFGPIGRNPVDSSEDNSEESETFVAVEPDNGQRFATYGNDIGPSSGRGGLNVTTDGGADWTHLLFPTTFDVKGTVVDETADPAGDPILAADDSGNIWAGGLSLCSGAVSADRIFVNRVSGTPPVVSAKSVGLPVIHGGTVCGVNDQIQDKPQMTIDNTPSSPTFGRLYVVWDDPDPSGGTNLVVSYCNTRPTVTACDSADNWTNPTIISDISGGGSYISSHVAVGPDGKVYVVWWDYSGANAIAIDTCDPAAHSGNCNAAGFWGTDRVVASLSFHNGFGVPFACPTVAQPGGRAAPVPSLAIDHSGGASQGRIYVAWSDLGTKGAHRCTGLSDTPQADQDPFKSYVASAPDYATLTSDPTTLSHERGTNVIGDAGDHWFPWVAVDQTSGHAYVDLYSTRDDASRETARFYARAVVAGVGSTRVSYGPLTAVSGDATDYSDQKCCNFGNNYGDYTGLDATAGNIYAVWTHRLLGGDGDVYVNVLPVAATPTEVPADDAFSVTPPPPPPPTDTTPTTTPPPTDTTPTGPTPDRTAPRLSVTFATRVDRRGRYTLRLQAAGEPASGMATMRMASGRKRKLGSGLIATSGTKPLKVVIKLKRKDFKLLERKGRFRVRLTVSLSDVAGNTAKGAKTFSLRRPRR